jgi:hypothetical protein
MFAQDRFTGLLCQTSSGQADCLFAGRIKNRVHANDTEMLVTSVQVASCCVGQQITASNQCFHKSAGIEKPNLAY